MLADKDSFMLCLSPFLFIFFFMLPSSTQSLLFVVFTFSLNDICSDLDLRCLGECSGNSWTINSLFDAAVIFNPGIPILPLLHKVRIYCSPLMKIQNRLSECLLCAKYFAVYE